MKESERSQLVIGIILVLLGLLFLAYRLVPGLEDQLSGIFSWPVAIIGVGVVLVVIGLIGRDANMVASAGFVTGLGGLLYWQNLTGNWGSWAYAWALLPGFGGIGTVLSSLVSDEPGKRAREGMRQIMISLVLFAIFGSFLGGFDLIGPFWPVLLIVAGLWFLIEGFIGKRN
jgi:hypothetical protein